MSAGRARGELNPPTPPRGSLAEFPGRDAAGLWFRSHQRRDSDDAGCWWFSGVDAGDDSARRGRFDLRLPRGTCYFGSSAEVAVRERWGAFFVLILGREYLSAATLVMAGDVVVSQVHLPRGTLVADLLSADAVRWGVTNELSAGTGIYSVTQMWAQSFDADGWQGVCYRPRFTTDKEAKALGLFGQASPLRKPMAVSASQDAGQVLRAMGVLVVDIPSSRQCDAHVVGGDSPPESL